MQLGSPLPWHAGDWQRLRDSLGAGRLHHGILLGGPAGIGKRILAARLASAILCLDPRGGEPCGSCKSCTLLVAGSHPDMLRIVPEEPGKQIRIAQVRNDLGDFVMRTASVARAKAIVIDPADAMNHSTANCLLKSLEEPAPLTHLLLVSDAPARLLPTVRSRCEQLRLHPPAPEDGLRWLESMVETPQARDVLEISGGCPLRALDLLREGGSRDFLRVAAVMQRAADRDAWVPVLVSEMADLDLRTLLDWILVFLTDFARGIVAGLQDEWRLSCALQEYRVLHGRIDPRGIAQMLQRTLSARRDAVSNANPNRQLLLEALLIEWRRACAD